MSYKKLYIILVFAGSAALLSVCILFLSSSYESLIRLMIEVSKKPYLESVLRTQIFTNAKYLLIKNVCIAMLAVVPVCAVLLLRYQHYITSRLQFVLYSVMYTWKKVKLVYSRNTRTQNITIILLLGIIAAKSLYYITQYDLQYDEMWSYNYFTVQPFYYSFFVNSNYPLYEIITGLFKYLPFEMKVNIRLPVLIAGLLACIVLYVCLRAYFKNHLAAVGGMIVFACMPVSTFYMLYARGVMLALLFAIISIFSILFWLRNNSVTAYLVIYALASAAGVYAMPTNAYVCVPLFLLVLLICLIKHRRHIKNIIAANVTAGLLSLLAYLPIIAGSGISFLYNAAVDTTSARPAINDILTYHASASLFFTGYTAGLLLLMAVVFLLLLLNRQLHQHLALLTLVCCLYFLPAIIYIFQNVQLPMRSLAFVGLLIPLLYSLGIFLLVKKISGRLMFSLIIISGTGAAYISHEHHYLNWSRNLDTQAKQLAHLFIHHHIVSCYDNSKGTDFFYDYPALEYYYKINRKEFALTVADKGSLRYKPFVMTDKYDCVISRINDTISAESYHEIYRDEKRNFKVLLRNN